MKLLGVRPSVRPSVIVIRPPHAAAAGLLLGARRQQRRAPSGKCESIVTSKAKHGVV